MRKVMNTIFRHPNTYSSSPKTYTHVISLMT